MQYLPALSSLKIIKYLLNMALTIFCLASRGLSLKSLSFALASDFFESFALALNVVFSTPLLVTVIRDQRLYYLYNTVQRLVVTRK